MMRTGYAVFAAPALVALACGAMAQESGDLSKMSAREIFYSAPKVKKEPPSAPAPKPPRPPRPDPAPAESDPIKVVKNDPPAPPPAPSPPMEDKGQFIPAAIIDPPRLGLRCSVLKRGGGSSLTEVDPETAFHSGDRIRLRVRANDDGYLYVILRGSSGVWKPLFPSKETGGGSNFITGGLDYDVPEGHVFTFDDQPGEEKLFVILSRSPVNDLESLIYDLEGKVKETPIQGRPEAPHSDKTLLAQNLIRINDDVVNRLRTAYARDLIIEKVDDAAANDNYGKETAVYAVATATNSDSRVVVDLTLAHR